MFKQQTAALCLIAATVSQACSQTFSLQELVEAHESGRNSIQGIELEMQHDAKNYLGDKFFSSQHSPTYRWAQEGDRERNRYDVGVKATEDGRPQGLYDWYVDGNSFRLLRNWAPQKPQPITPLDQGTVSAQIHARTRVPLGIDVTGWLVWTFLHPAGQECRTLRELVRESPSAQLLDRTQVEGCEVWHLRVQAPGDMGKSLPKCHFDIFVEPARSFQVRRMMVRQERFEQQVAAGKIETVPFEQVRTVKRFQDFGDGVFVPVELETRTRVKSSDSRLTVTTTQVKVLGINRTLSSEALDFRFPQHVQVIDTRVGQTPNAQQVQLWGANNKPVKEITRQEDIPGYVEAIAQGKPPKTDANVGNFSPLLMANLVFLTGAILFVAYRRYRR